MAKKKEEAPDGSTIEGIEPLLEQFRNIKDSKETLQASIKKLNEQETYTEQLIISKLRAEGLTAVKSIYGSASISEQEYPAIKDRNKMLDWIVKNKRWELLPATIKSAAWREAVNDGDVIPGVEAYKEDVLSFRRTKVKP